MATPKSPPKTTVETPESLPHRSTPKTRWQSIQKSPKRTRLDAQYDIYLSAARDLGWHVKSFDEWLNS